MALQNLKAIMKEKVLDESEKKPGFLKKKLKDEDAPAKKSPSLSARLMGK